MGNDDSTASANWVWGSPFSDPKDLNNSQLLFQTAICCYVLFQASNLISDGSEFLLLVPALAGIVGSIVLPILGAVPDGMMVFFSATGTDVVEMQDSLKVGVGALAGSTVMLLTIPWCIAVVFGRAPLSEPDENGDRVAEYDKVKGDAKAEGLKHPFFDSGITVTKEIAGAAKIMLGTSLIYLVILIPAIATEGLFAESRNVNETLQQITDEDKVESLWAIIGLVVSIIAFCGYLYKCYKESCEDKVLAKIIDGIQNHEISMGTALQYLKEDMGGDAGNAKLLTEAKKTTKLNKVLRPFFARYDVDGNGNINFQEFQFLLLDLGERVETQAAKQMFDLADTTKDGQLVFGEFTEHLRQYLDKKELKESAVMQPRATIMAAYSEEEEEEEMPEELIDLSPEQQRSRILKRAFGMMGAGTALVLAFSDPMVDILGEIGARVGVSPFYISFVLAPMASNASELVSAKNYAQKKTKKSLTTSISTLIGAACMNNTFCMSIFLVMVVVQGLAWQFTAETIATMLVQWIIGAVCLKTDTHTTKLSFVVLGCYPLCLFIVYFLENFCSMD